MPPRKRTRLGEPVDEQDTTVSSDHAVCDQCRVKKIRCDRERPQCSNCARAGHECEWSGHGKKPSQTVLLSHAVMGLAKRLEELEGAMSSIHDRLDTTTTTTTTAPPSRSLSRTHSRNRLSTLSTTTSTTRLNSLTTGSSSTTEPVPSTSRSSASVSVSVSVSPSPVPSSSTTPPFSPFSKIRPPAYLRVISDNGLERCLGPTSLACLLRDLDAEVLAPLQLQLQVGEQDEAVAQARGRIGGLARKDGHGHGHGHRGSAGGGGGGGGGWGESVGVTAGVWGALASLGTGAGTGTGQDGRPPASPPLGILEGMVDAYLEGVNPSFPIWTRKGLERLVAMLRGPPLHDDRDRGVVVCANYVVLSTLASQRLRSRARAQAQVRDMGGMGEKGLGLGLGLGQQHGCNAMPAVDADLIRSFLANARRATANIELLLAPRLVNVQALLSLCVVAQEYFDADLFDFLRNLAVQVARSIGLGRSEASHDLDPEGSQERQNVLYCLHLVDKAAGWATGLGASMPISTPEDDETAAEQTSTSPGSLETSRLTAMTRMAYIEERILADIYCPEARTPTSEHINWAIAHWEQKLQAWRATWIDDNDNPQELSAAETEAAISFHSARLLLHWPARHDPAVSEGLLDDARKCLGLFLRLWEATSEASQCTNLARLVASYPPVALCRLVSAMLLTAAPLSTPGRSPAPPLSAAVTLSPITPSTVAYGNIDDVNDSDLTILNSFTDLLCTLTELSDATSHNAQLRDTAQALTVLVRAVAVAGCSPVNVPLSLSSANTCTTTSSSMSSPQMTLAAVAGHQLDLSKPGPSPHGFARDVVGLDMAGVFHHMEDGSYEPHGLHGILEVHEPGVGVGGEDVFGDGWNWLNP